MSSTRNKSSKKRKRPRKPKQGPQVTCVLCGESYDALTKAHLTAHGYTQEQYRRTFGAPLTPGNIDPYARGIPSLYQDEPLIHPLTDQHLPLEQPTPLPTPTEQHHHETTPPHQESVHPNPDMRAPSLHTSPTLSTVPLEHEPWQPPPVGAVDPRLGEHPGTASGLPPILLRQLASHLVRHPEYLARVSTDVSQALMSGPQRDMLSQGLSALIMTRISLHGSAVDRLQNINNELGQQWRIDQGGEGGGPTSNKDLVMMHSAALAEMRSGEDLLIKAVKVAIDEQKHRQSVDGAAIPMDRYKGGGTKNLVERAQALSGAERETVRQLLGMLVEGAEAKATIVESAAAPLIKAKVVSTKPAPQAERTPPAPTPPPDAVSDMDF